MTRASYLGTHKSQIYYGQVGIPPKTLNQIRLRERTFPTFFYAFALKEGALPYIYLLHPDDLEEKRTEIEDLSRSKDISDIIQQIEVRDNRRLVIPKELREFAQFYNNTIIYFVGNIDHIELWNERIIKAQEKRGEALVARHPQKVEELDGLIGR